MPKVIEIPASQKETNREAKASRTKRRVAGYVRVILLHVSRVCLLHYDLLSFLEGRQRDL